MEKYNRPDPGETGVDCGGPCSPCAGPEVECGNSTVDSGEDCDDGNAVTEASRWVASLSLAGREGEVYRFSVDYHANDWSAYG